MSARLLGGRLGVEWCQELALEGPPQSHLGNSFHDIDLRCCPLDRICQVLRDQVPDAERGLAFSARGN